jgi:DNA modification methylase
MSLYFQDDFVTLYHGDCLTEHREWLAADVLVTDPPYGMSYKGFGGRNYWDDASKYEAIAGDADTQVRDSVLEAWGERPALVFGTWRVQRPIKTRQLIIWNKQPGPPGMGALDLPWGPSHEEVYALGKGFVGKREGSVITAPSYNSQATDRPDHPTPKPVGLMEQLIIKCPPGVIADPSAGGGATLVAARNLGRKSIGVELEEKYCEVIAKRFDQGALELEWTA